MRKTVETQGKRMSRKLKVILGLLAVMTLFFGWRWLGHSRTEASDSDSDRSADAVAHRLFGMGEPTERFLSRIGNVLIIPTEDNLIWHREYRKDPAKLKGTHGGLSLEELLIPFGAARLEACLRPSSS